MKQILIINLNILGNSPQPIRMRNLIHHWQKKANITLVTMNNFGDEDPFPGENVKVVKTPFSTIGKILISNPVIATKQYIEARKTFSRVLKEWIIRLWRASIFYRMMFPDKFIFEHANIIDSVKKLKRAAMKFDLVIISAAPFSLQKLGRVMKKLYPDAPCIYDTGDPFYGNTTLLLIKPLRTYFAKRFENKYLRDFDHVIVPTQVLKDHYLLHFGHILTPGRIKVIEQGIEELFSTVQSKTLLKPNELHMVYAGGLYKNLREPFEVYKAIEEYNSSKIRLRIFGNIYRDFLPKSSEKFYFGGSISSGELLQEYQSCDVTLFIDNLSGIQIPGKVLELISIKRPILFVYGNPDSPTLSLIKDNNRVVKCENTSASIKEGLRYIIENYGSFTYDDLPKKYFWSSLADKYMEGWL